MNMNNFASQVCGLPPARKPFTVRTQAFDYTLAGVDLACQIEYEAAERETHDEPGEPAIVILHSAKVNGTDIYELLDDEQRIEIEGAFLIQGEEA